jgi:DNA primase
VLRQDADGPDVKYVVVVEGIIDALSVAQMATKRHSVIVGLLGAAKFRPEWWTALAIRYPNATWLVATDADKAGDEAAERILASLPAGVPSKRMRPPAPAKDWNDVLCAKEGVSAAPAVTVAA